MDAIFELISLVVSVVIRVGIIVVVTPFVLLWPRRDKNLTHWQVVLSRFKKVLGQALT